MYEYWYNYVKAIYGEKAKPCYMDTNSFTVHVKSDDIYQDIEKDVETRFATSNYGLKRPPPKGKNKKVSAIKDALGAKVIEKVVELTVMKMKMKK